MTDNEKDATDGEQFQENETPWELAEARDSQESAQEAVDDLSGDREPDPDGVHVTDDEIDANIGFDGRPRRWIPAFGEIVSKRHPFLIALVMIFALFLAVAPLLFRYERNAMHEAVVVYTRVCEARETGHMTDDWLTSMSGPGLLSMSPSERAAFVEGLECLDPKTHSFALRLVEGRALGPDRAYVLSVFKGEDIKKVEKAGGQVTNFFFPVVDDRLVLDVMPAGGQ